VVSTPIGNLSDVTLRALDVLRSVPLVAAEDTRLTRRLFERHGIESRLVSYHARSAEARTRELLDHLRGGRDLALVTDAGTPGVSDPGGELVRLWAAEGGRVTAIPGASAVLAAVAVSGVAGPRWAFEGFLARRGRARREALTRIAADDRASVLFEAPNRVAATLSDLATACGLNRAGAVCRELTKVHETISRGSLDELARMAAEGEIPPRGEFVIVVGYREPNGQRDEVRSGEVSLAEAAREVESLVAEGVARGEAARRVSARTGIPRRAIYRPGRTA
jgi:16S rRNA (cytidine1402-2'-O)-methyltransferase